MPRTTRVIATGSSPLTRGKLLTGGGSNGKSGLIPAHAGKTDCADLEGRITRAHPRSRGENICSPCMPRALSGSSPLTRGKRQRAALDSHRERLIPAHAGKTDSGRIQPRVFEAHPRSRGENTVGVEDTCLTTGSSPLTRGKPLRNRERRDQRRLIPAHAGKTHLHGSPCAGYRAHPRSRGENSAGSRTKSSRRGSSPLTRGKPLSLMMCISAFRLIPAHAGKTSRLRPRSGPVTAHPRSRGENGFRALSTASTRGSSPLTRGKRHPARTRRTEQRLIPAHAGKTVTGAALDPKFTAHPRSRGENLSCWSGLRGA